ncbi:hypothetical protein CVU83_03490 [Candidatus Falkowbacteria bacterium HGW-Falkowbacteria-2]|uniref:HAD family hydrolase n=1 Tax=Candidatus Falkowbacteria bacterium HGW-Falkowbacteria-2 TaxID=2013769 RepID=A0A2N2DX81_9BACT|nr:MAG: hypothetical protein CVU83_03490 [Candidatus Falkowbacteria bacterium HGW-Falkowbacteria-2]
MESLILDLIGPVLPISPSIDKFREAAQLCELSPPTTLFLRKHWDRNLETDFILEIAKRMVWSKAQMQEVLEMYVCLLNKLTFPSDPKLRRTMEELAGKYRLGLITNQSHEFLERHLSVQDVDVKMFSHICVTSNQLRKPNPAVLDSFKSLGFNPDTSVYVGDSVDYDYKTIVNDHSKYKFIAIKGGADDGCDFRLAGVAYRLILNRLDELPQIMREI